MRTDQDVSHYIPMADDIETGHPIAEKDRQWPIGYPLAIVALRHVGCGGNLGLIGFNLVGLGIGLAAFGALATRDLKLSQPAIAIVLACTLLSRFTFDMATIAQPELPFMGSTMGSLLCLSVSATSRRPFAWIVAATVLAAVSTELRTIGIALFPAIGVSVLRLQPRWAWPMAAAAVCGALVITQTKYFGILTERFAASGSGFVLSSCIAWRLEELGQVVTNLSRHNLPYLVGYDFPRIGAIALAAVAVGAWKYRRSPIAPYLVCYAALILISAFRDLLRFYVPILPFLFALAWIASRDLWRAART